MGIVNCDLREHLSIEKAGCFFETVDKGAVIDTVCFGGGRYSNDPPAAKVSLAPFAISVCEGEGSPQCFSCLSKYPPSASDETLDPFEEAFPPPPSFKTSFYSHLSYPLFVTKINRKVKVF